MLPLVLISLLSFTSANLAPGTHVYNYSERVDRVSTADEYSCFVDAPHDHVTTGCRKFQNNCSTSQAICYFSEWDGTNYKWSWECARQEFNKCGLRWCGLNSECVSINNCQCSQGLEGNPLFMCYNATELNITSDPDVIVIYDNQTDVYINEEDKFYFIGFWSAVAFIVLNIFIFIFIVIIRCCKHDKETFELEKGIEEFPNRTPEAIEAHANETYGYVSSFSSPITPHYDSFNGDLEESYMSVKTSEMM